METVFLVCFAFGALFTAISAIVGLAHTSVPGADVGHFGHFAHAPHAAHTPHVPHVGPHGVHVPHGAHGAHAPHAPQGGHVPGGVYVKAALLPFLNASSLLAFLTWFGAAGYLALRFGGWPLGLTLAAALSAGLAGALLLGLFLHRVLAGEQHLDPSEFKLEGTLARVSVSIPAAGAGEIVFTKAGRRRSEAARSATGRAIPRGAEVVILQYERGMARVQLWDELLNERPPPDGATHLTAARLLAEGTESTGAIESTQTTEKTEDQAHAAAAPAPAAPKE